MPPILEGLVPVFLVIAVGWATRVTGFITTEHWNGFERVTYYVLIPALVMTTLVMADLARLPIGSVGVALVAPTVLVGVVLVIARAWMERAFEINGPAFTSIFQGSVRWNSFVAVALAAALYGKDGVALTAVAFAFLIPSVNLMSAWALARYGSSGASLTVRSLAVGMLKNPFIWSTFGGIALGASGLPVPKFATTFGDILGRAALAAGLLMAGSGLDLANLRKPGAGLWISIVLRLLCVPLVTGLLGQLLGLNGVQLAVPIICSAVPTAAASYILARQNGGDAPLMASIITAQTIAAAVTMPLILLIFSQG